MRNCISGRMWEGASGHFHELGGCHWGACGLSMDAGKSNAKARGLWVELKSKQLYLKVPHHMEPISKHIPFAIQLALALMTAFVDKDHLLLVAKHEILSHSYLGIWFGFCPWEVFETKDLYHVLSSRGETLRWRFFFFQHNSMCVYWFIRLHNNMCVIVCARFFLAAQSIPMLCGNPSLSTQPSACGLK